MRIRALAAAALLAACTHLIPTMDAPASLAAAETAFAAHSVREDMRAAFLEHFAADGVLVRNGWANARADLTPRAAPPILLEWRPQYVEVAASGEVGLSTGPSRISSKADRSRPPVHGQFVSIWRRAPGGPWKVEVDLGISHPAASLWDQPLEARTVPHVGGAVTTNLVEAEAQFQQVAGSRGTRAAYGALGARDLRLYRNGETPRASLEAALQSPAAREDGLLWTCERVETAKSGDFGYARGRYARAAEPDATLGYFLRAWRREAAGWRIVIDVANPAPRPPA
jgi:ketosteroid isomerase-like protein